MLPGAAIFFYLHDIEQADILHSTQKNWFSVSPAFPLIFGSRPAFPFYSFSFTHVPQGTSFQFSPDIFTYYFFTPF